MKNWNNTSDINFITEELKKNKVFISSTDTIYGFLGNTTKESYDKIRDLKKISEERPFLILISSIDKLSSYINTENLSKKVLKFISKCWPGPITFIFKAKQEQKTIALRCPKHDGLQKILKEFDGLFSTSANISSQPPPKKHTEIDRELIKKVEAVIIDEPEIVNTQPSTIVNLAQGDGDLPFTIVREGAFSKEKIERYFLS